MMFAGEPPGHSGRQRDLGHLSPFSSPSPINYSPRPHDLTTPPSPVKMEGSYYPPSPAMKLEPLSPSNVYLRSTGRGALESQSSPCASSLDSISISYSPMTSPHSPSSTTTLSPSTKIGRDDLSPASSINSFGGDPNDKKKKGLGRQTEELCLVCGDRASGYHYNALTCEGCKGFFRRSVTKNAVYSCKYGNNCEMDMYMRRKCQECRLKKCVTVGMKPECVVPEQTCQAKREQKKARDKDKNSFSPIQDISKQPLGNGLPNLISIPASLQTNGKIELTNEQQKLINKIIQTQEFYESPNDDIIKSSAESGYQNITEMTKLTVELVVHFANNIPGFDSISTEDKITLLKACSSELIVLRASRRYHGDLDSIVFADNVPHKRDYYIHAGMSPQTVDALFNFCKKMHVMEVDNAEYALLSSIDIFSMRPALLDPSRVEHLQYIYLEALYAYEVNKRASKAGMMVAKLIDVLTQLRTLSLMNNEQCESFFLSDREVPELLTEVWDVHKKT